MSFFKTKKFYIIVAVIVVIGVIGWRVSVKKSAAPQYETTKVTRGGLEQTVEATGKIESATDLALKFEIGGIVDVVNIKEGDSVKTGTILANLRLAELNAAVAQASANLNQKLVGLSDSDIKYYQAAVDSARSSFEQAKSDAQASITSAQAAVDTAKNNLKLSINALMSLDENNFTKENIKNVLMLIADSLESRGELLHPVRFALSGKDQSPDPFIIASIIGKNETLHRLQKAI